MTHIPGQRDGHLHNEDGTHITTARTANGHDLDIHERQITRHLAEHEAPKPVSDPLLDILNARPNCDESRPHQPHRWVASDDDAAVKECPGVTNGPAEEDDLAALTGLPALGVGILAPTRVADLAVYACRKLERDSVEYPMKWVVLCVGAEGPESNVVWTVGYSHGHYVIIGKGEYRKALTEALAVFAIKAKLWYPGIDLAKQAHEIGA